MGRGTHRRRTPAENRSSNFSSDDSTLYSEAPSASGEPGPALDDFRAQSHEGHHRHRLLCRCDSNVPVDYVFVIMELDTRRILHFNVTQHPTAEWTLQQFRECVSDDEGYRFVIHDR